MAATAAIDQREPGLIDLEPVDDSWYVTLPCFKP